MFTALLVGALVVGGLCGDCNQDGQVTIAELVQAVANAMAPPCNCTHCPAEACVEFPFVFDQGVRITCSASVCDNEIDACVRGLDAEGLCTRSLP